MDTQARQEASSKDKKTKIEAEKVKNQLREELDALKLQEVNLEEPI